MMKTLFTHFPYQRLIKFGAVGFSGTLVNLVMLYCGQEYLFFGITHSGLRLNLSLALAISVATLNNFTWNRLWTWRDRPARKIKSLGSQLFQYTLAAGLAIALQILMTNMLTEYLHYLVANLIAIIIAAVINYWANDVWTFALRRHLIQSPTDH